MYISVNEKANLISLRILLYISVLFLTACKNQIDINNIEQREHKLSYIKGTNKLVDGEVIRKFKNGKTAELHNYKAGKAIGDWFAFGYKAEILSYGFGVDAQKYEAELPGTDLTYSFLSINITGNITSSFAYATLCLDNPKYFDDPKILLGISKEIFHEYATKYKIDDILIYDKDHNYTISKRATITGTYKIDTISSKGMKSIYIH